MIKRSIDLLVPAAIFGIGLLAINALRYGDITLNKECLWNIMVATLRENWFLLTLACVSVCMAGMSAMGIETKKLFVLFVAITFLAYPFCIVASQFGLYFAAYCFGMMYRENGKLVTGKKALFSGLLFPPVAIILFSTVGWDSMSNIVCKAISASLSCPLLLYVFKESAGLGERKLLNWAGRNSLEIYVLHMWTFCGMRAVFGGNLHIENMAASTAWVVNVSMATIGLAALFIKCFGSCRFMVFFKKPSKFLFRNIQ